MLETLFPVVVLVEMFQHDVEVAEALLVEGHQVLQITVERPVGDLLEAPTEIRDVMLRTCQGDVLNVASTDVYDVVAGVDIVLGPKVEVCGVRIFWEGEVRLFGDGALGMFEVHARDPQTTVRLRQDRGRQALQRWRVTSGRMADADAPQVRVIARRPALP